MSINKNFKSTSRNSRLRRLITRHNDRSTSGGFTIVELLVATLVFSVVLVLITEGVIQFNRAYYGGITQSSTQNTARNILENISQAVQFSGDQITSPIASNGSSLGLCIGSTRYSYLLGQELVTGTPASGRHQTNHSVIEDTPGNCGGLQAQDLTKSVSGTELLSPNMRISKLTVKQVSGSTNLWDVDVRVVYGDDDLLYSPSGNGQGPAAPDAKCHFNWSGAQFCATSELSTVVEQRVIN